MEWERLDLNSKLTLNMHSIRNTEIIHLATGNGTVSSQAYLDRALSLRDGGPQVLHLNKLLVGAQACWSSPYISE